MSAPAPPKRHPKHAEPHAEGDPSAGGIGARIAVRKAAERRRQRGTLVVSAVLHAALAAALLYLTPLAALYDPTEAAAPAPSDTLSTAAIHRLDEQIEAIQSAALEERVEELEALHQEMRALEQESREDYAGFAERLVERAPDDLLAAAQGAVKAMGDAEAALAAGNPQAADDAQARAEALQEQVRERLEVLPEGATAQAKPAQAEADAAQRAASGALDEELRAAGQTTGQDKNPPALRNAERGLKNARDQADRREREVQRDRGKLDQTLDQIRVEQARVASGGGPNLAKAQQRLRNLEHHAEGQRTQATQSRERHAAQLAVVDQRAEELQAVQDTQQTQQDEATTHREQAGRLQSGALALQRAALTHLADAAALARERATEPRPDVPTPSGQAAGAPTGTSIAELYDAAAATERRLTDAFENIRAMELSVIRNLPLDAARRAVDDVTPVREGIDRAGLERRARGVDGLAAKRDAAGQTVREVDAMIDLARLLHAQLQSREAQQGVGRLAMALADQSAAAGTDAAPGGGPGEGTPPPPDRPDTRGLGQSQAGRHIAAGGEPARWLTPARWYVIGPWDNTGRRNRDRQFPPESVVDLDAVYLGKRGTPIRWDFMDVTHPQGRIQPVNAEPYGVWYATTEIHLDTAQRLWVALGSDDRGTLWVNQRRVWVSRPEHKEWRADEALVPVDFDAGRNRLLLRCENGQSIMGFSAALRLEPVAP